VTVLHGPPADIVCKNCAAPNAWWSPAPPAQFDPLTASQPALDFYGLPPRPDPLTAPGPYGEWLKMVTAPVTRVTPHLVTGNISFGASVIGVPPPTTQSAATVTTNPAWSGFAIVDSSGPFKVAKTTIYADFVVPTLFQPVGTCSSTPYWYVAWPGIDGYNTPDVLQAGVAGEATCAANKTTETFYVWTQWYPAKIAVDTSFVVTPGDTLTVAVWATSATAGKALIEDTQRNTSIEVNIPAPSGTSLSGKTAEWIVEAPSGGYPKYPLGHYATAGWFNLFVAVPVGTATRAYYPGSSPTGTVYNITMDEDGSPASVPQLFGTSALWFYTTGAAK
jgi:hypothetical protein